MKGNRFLRVPTQPIDVEVDSDIAGLITRMRRVGFQGRKLAEIVDIWTNMLREKRCVIWLGLAGAMIPAGMRKLISYLIQRRMIDVLVTTGANLYHDTYEARGLKHYMGSPNLDDVALRKAKVDRIYDVLGDENRFYDTDKWIEKHLCDRLDDDTPYSSREILETLGEVLYKIAGAQSSITLDAYKSGIPIYCPALNDSSLGFSLTFANRRRKRRIIFDGLKDIDETAMITEKAQMTGVIYLGGGVPKNFIQQTAVVAGYQLNRDKSHNYAIQITTDMPVWGGLSGCTFEEAQSWGKISSGARMATCYSDITIALPLVVHALAQKHRKLSRNVPVFKWTQGNLGMTYRLTKT